MINFVTQAKNHLRRKHKIQQRLDRCTVALENVQQLLQQMRETHVNVAIVDSYRYVYWFTSDPAQLQADVCYSRVFL